MNQQVSTLIKSLELGEPKNFRNMDVFPLFYRVAPENRYLTVSEALGNTFIEVTEVSEHGSVPNLLVINHGEIPVLIVDGEELVGAKQNRIVNTSILLAPGSKTVIPVSCTEQGRWRYDSPKFHSSPTIMNSLSRAAKNKRMTENLKTSKAYDANQQAVWNDIATVSYMLKTSSRTGALQDIFKGNENKIGDYVNQFPILKGQKGIMVFLNGKPAGFDFLSQEEAYASLHDKFIRSYAFDALYDSGKNGENDLQIEGYKFIHSLAECEETTHQPVGMGTDYRYQGRNIIGAALNDKNEVIHLNASRIEEEEKSRKNEANSTSSDIRVTPHIREEFLRAFRFDDIPF